MNDRILILGAEGQLGRGWQAYLDAERIPYEAWSRRDLDLAEPRGLDKLERSTGVGLIVNCSAYTQVDQAESDYERALAVNATAVGELGRCATRMNARLLHYSTDYVFDGQASTPYPTDHPLAPVNAYGRSKAEGERLLKESGARALLIRTSWVYAPWGKNFVLTMMRLLREKPELRVVYDQVGHPSSAQQLARRSFALSRQVEQGVFHLTDAGQCSWYELTIAIRDELGLDTPVHPIPTSSYPTPAKRPAYSVLDTSKADDLIGPARPWRAELHDVVALAEAGQPKPR